MQQDHPDIFRLPTFRLKYFLQKTFYMHSTAKFHNFGNFSIFEKKLNFGQKKRFKEMIVFISISTENLQLSALRKSPK